MTADGVVIGRVVKAHGLRGEVAVEVLSDVADRFAAGTPVTVGDTERVIASTRPHKGRQLVSFEDVPDRTAAEALRGQQIQAAAVDTEYLLFDELVGMAVVTEDGIWQGDVVEILEVPAAAGYELLEVDRDGRRWLLPNADELVEVADADGTDVLCVIDPPAGLLPDDEDDAVVVREGE